MKGKRVHDCPFCESGSLMAKDSRSSPLENVLRRRIKQCDTCGERVTTHEVIINDDREGSNQSDMRALLFLRDVERSYREHFDYTKVSKVMAGLGRRK